MVEVVLLANTIVTKFFVPLFKKGRDGFADGVTDASGRVAGAGLVAAAEQLWERVKRRFDRDDEKKAIDLFQAEPEDMEKLLAKLLAKRLEEDAQFRQEIQQLVDAPVPGTGQTSWQLLGGYVGAVDARGATISGGTVAGLIVNPKDSPSTERTTDAPRQ
jgi:hypothetical protein